MHVRQGLAVIGALGLCAVLGSAPAVAQTYQQNRPPMGTGQGQMDQDDQGDDQQTPPPPGGRPPGMRPPGTMAPGGGDFRGQGRGRADPLRVRMFELRTACQAGDRRACVQFGIIIGENRERRGQWRRDNPDLFWYER